MRNRIIYYLSMSAIALFNLLIIYVFFTMVYPFEVVHFDKFQTVNDTVKRGNLVCVDMSFDKKLPLKADISWFYVGDLIYTIDADSSIYRKVGYNDTVRCFTANIPAGEYRIQVELHYELLGGWRELNYAQESNKFKVIE